MMYTEQQANEIFAEIAKHAEHASDFMDKKHLMRDGMVAYAPTYPTENFNGAIFVEYWGGSVSSVRAEFHSKSPNNASQITNKSLGFAVAWLEDKFAEWKDARRNQKESYVDENGDTVETCYFCHEEDLVDDMYHLQSDDGKRTPVCDSCARGLIARGEIEEDELEPLANYNFQHESKKSSVRALVESMFGAKVARRAVKESVFNNIDLSKIEAIIDCKSMCESIVTYAHETEYGNKFRNNAEKYVENEQKYLNRYIDALGRDSVIGIMQVVIDGTESVVPDVHRDSEGVSYSRPRFKSDYVRSLELRDQLRDLYYTALGMKK